MIAARTHRLTQERESLTLNGETALMLSLLSGVPRQDLERHLRHSPLLARLAGDLRELEQRLGTDDERPADLAQAQTLGHQIRNLLCMAVLADEARTLLGPGSNSASPYPACA